MKLKINDKIFEKYPSLNLGVIVVQDFDNSGESQEILSLLQELSNDVRSRFDFQKLTDEPKLQVWREAYSAFGAKPKKYSCSVENLYRMLLEGIELHHINKIVDIYNYISIKYMVPIGGDDIDRVDGDIELRFAVGDEIFAKLNSQEVDNPKAGEVIYVDDKEVLCRRWNWRECDKTKMTETTSNAALVIEGLSPIMAEDINLATNEFKQLIEKFCGGRISTHILNINNKEVEI